jgi:ferrous iron transport protein A
MGDLYNKQKLARANLLGDWVMNISNCELHTEYQIASIMATEADMKDFLFTLGCYPGERIVLISRLPSMYVVDIKNSRYSIDDDLARAICLREPERVDQSNLVNRVV